VFAPKFPDAEEGEGYGLCIAYEWGRGASKLLILDADDISGGPLATVESPIRIPAGFHGSWVAA